MTSPGLNVTLMCFNVLECDFNVTSSLTLLVYIIFISIMCPYSGNYNLPIALISSHSLSFIFFIKKI